VAKPGSTELETAALSHARAAWPDLAPRVGANPVAHTLSMVSCRREGPDGARCVVRAAGATHFALKFRLPVEPARFATLLQAHDAAARALEDVPDVAAVPVLAHDAPRGVLVLPWVSGASLDDHLAGSPNDLVRTLTLAGRILGGLVSGAPTETAPFAGGWQLRRLDAMARNDIPNKAAFHQYRTVLGALAGNLAGAAMTKGRIHGDFRLANLIWDGVTLTAPDLENTRTHPVVRDAAQFLVDASVWAGSHPIDGDSTHGFFEALALPPDDRRVLQFFVAFRLLSLWAGTPRPKWQRSPRQMHQLRRARKVVPVVLDA